jgi:azurin
MEKRMKVPVLGALSTPKRVRALLFACALAGTLGVAACNRTPAEFKVDLASVGEQMAYDKKEITVPAGSKVTITLKNNATAAVMTHNFVLVQQGMVDAVGAAAASVPIEKGFVPSHYAIIASSPLTKPGESVTFSFPAPPTGTYEFLCTTPGHYAVMRGTFIVK